MFHALQQKLSHLTSYPIFFTLLSTSIRNAMQSFEIPLSLFPLTTSFFASLSPTSLRKPFSYLFHPSFFHPLSSYVVHGGMKCMIRSYDIISLSSCCSSFRLFILASLYMYNDSIDVKEKNQILTLSFTFYFKKH